MAEQPPPDASEQAPPVVPSKRPRSEDPESSEDEAAKNPFIEDEASEADSEDSEAKEAAEPLAPLPASQVALPACLTMTDDELRATYAPANEHLSPTSKEQLGERKRLFKRAKTVAVDQPVAVPEEEQPMALDSPPPHREEDEKAVEEQVAMSVLKEIPVPPAENAIVVPDSPAPSQHQKEKPVFRRMDWSSGDEAKENERSIEIPSELIMQREKITEEMNEKWGIICKSFEEDKSEPQMPYDDIPDKFIRALEIWGVTPMTQDLPKILGTIRLSMYSNVAARYCDYNKMFRSYTLLDLVYHVPGFNSGERNITIEVPAINDVVLEESFIEEHEAKLKTLMINIKTNDPETIFSICKKTIKDLFHTSICSPDKIFYLLEVKTETLNERVNKILGLKQELPIQAEQTPLDYMILRSSYLRFRHYVAYSSALLWIGEECIDPLTTTFMYNRLAGSCVYPIGPNFFIPYSVKTNTAGKSFVHRANIVGVQNKGGFKFIKGEWLIFIVGVLPADVLVKLIKQLHMILFAPFTYRIIDQCAVSYSEQCITYNALVLQKFLRGKSTELNLNTIKSVLEVGPPVQLREWHLTNEDLEKTVLPQTPMPPRHLIYRDEFDAEKWQPYPFMVGCQDHLWVRIMADFAEYSQYIENTKPTKIQHFTNRLFYDSNFSNIYNAWAICIFGAKLKSIHMLCGHFKAEARRLFGFEPGEIEFMFGCYHEGPRTEEEQAREQIEIDEADGRLGPLPIVEDTRFKQDWVVVVIKLFDTRRGGKKAWHPSTVEGNDVIVDFLTNTPLFSRVPAAHICGMAVSKRHFTTALGAIFTPKTTTSVYGFALPPEFMRTVSTRNDCETDFAEIVHIARHFGMNDMKVLEGYLSDRQYSVLLKNKGAIASLMNSSEAPKEKLVPDFNAERHVPFGCLSTAQQTLIEWIKKAYNNPVSQDDGRNLFVTGKTGIGKSAFVNWLYYHFEVYELKESNGFFDGIKETTEIIVVDDVKLNGAVLNYILHMMDSRKEARYNVKFGSIKLKINPRLIFLSNVHMDDYFDFIGRKYPDDVQDAYHRKFVRINLDITLTEMKCTAMLLDCDDYIWKGTCKVANTVPYFLRYYFSPREEKCDDGALRGLDLPNACDVDTDANLLVLKLDTAEDKSKLWELAQHVPRVTRIDTDLPFPDVIRFDNLNSIHFKILFEEVKKVKTLDAVKAELNAVISLFTNTANKGKRFDVNWQVFGSFVTQTVKDLARLFSAGTITPSQHEDLVDVLGDIKVQVVRAYVAI